MLLNENIVKAAAELNTQLNASIVAFIQTKVPGYREYSDTYQLSNSGLDVKHSYNTACHCHPEIKRDEHNFTLAELSEWIEANSN